MRRESLALLAAGSLLLTGCVTTAIVASTTSAMNAGGDAGTAVSQAQIDQFQVGAATVTDVEAKLGQPQQLAQKPDGGTTLTYIHRERTSDTQSYVPIARWAGGEVTIKTTSVVFDFNPAGKLLGSNTGADSFKCQLGKCPDLPDLRAPKSAG